MPVVITPMAKGLIPETHPCYAGVLFHSLSDYLEDIFEKTDLVIGLGYDPVEFNYESWMPDVPLVHFDIRGNRHAFREKTQLNIPDRLKNGSGFSEILMQAHWYLNLRLITGIRDEMMSVFNGFTNHFGPSAVLKILREELPGM